MSRSGCLCCLVLGAIVSAGGCADDEERGCDRGVYVGHMTISDDAELAQYEGYTGVTGDLTITCPSCDTIEELACLVSVGGDIDVSENGALTALDLGGLISMGGSLYLHGNPSLAEIGLDRLQMIKTWVTVRDNDGLAALRANNLLSIGGDVTISDNAALETMELDAIGRILGDLTVESNAGLQYLDAASLFAVDADLTISGNSALGSLDGLSSTSALGGALDVSDNSSLPFCEVCRLRSQLIGFAGEMTCVANLADACWTGTSLDCTQLPVDGNMAGSER